MSEKLELELFENGPDVILLNYEGVSHDLARMAEEAFTKKKGREYARMFVAALDLLEVVLWVAEHDKEFGDIEDAETMVFKMTERAKAVIAKHGL